MRSQTPSEAMNYSTVIKSIRSNALQYKNGLTYQQIENDFEEWEGFPIPLKEFGYANLESLLVDSNEFVITQSQRGKMVKIKPKEQTAHMMELINEQKQPKKLANRLQPKFNQSKHQQSKKPMQKFNGRICSSDRTQAYDQSQNKNSIQIRIPAATSFLKYRNVVSMLSTNTRADNENIPPVCEAEKKIPSKEVHNSKDGATRFSKPDTVNEDTLCDDFNELFVKKYETQASTLTVNQRLRIIAANYAARHVPTKQAVSTQVYFLNNLSGIL